MAEEDYNVADRKNVLTAGEKVSETVQATPDADAAAAARTANVSHPAYIGYAAALETHQERADIETLADRRAREYGSEFTDGDFMRRAPYDADGTVADPPRPGTVHGDAPKSA